ncbi:MAG: GGDEF domain-containing protein [Fibrobacter sp.]|nr:GGDEF domain-containing protein [Fibrobacter sp.]
MNPLFNLESIYVANIIGIILLAVMIVCNLWRLQSKTHANMNLLAMMFLTLLSCVADPISYTMKGLPGLLPKIAVYATSTWLFAANMLSVFCWNRFLAYYLNGSMSRKTRRMLNVTVSIGLLLLVINFFHPIVFSIDADNLYSREKFYFFFLIIDYLLVINSLITYYKSKRNGGILKFFPIWVYIVPILLGGVIQSLFYGISVVPTSIAISIAGILASLQNEMIYRDALTGIFNRAYLDYKLNKFAKRPNKQSITGLMLDLNGFKKINDDLGHSVGDEALIATTRILQRAVGSHGIVIRYAGDEFIVLINTQDDSETQTYIDRIQKLFEKYNQDSEKPYKLTASIGSHKLNLKEESVDSFINTIDSRMYENKKAFYASHRVLDRRKH